MTASPITLDRASKALGWPSRDEVLNPQGAGSAVYADLVQRKIGRVLSRMPDGQDARIGVLAADPNDEGTNSPIAIVVEFPSFASDDSLRELHRLAWNFSHSPTLITLEPALLRVWSCCEAPRTDQPIERALVHVVEPTLLEGEDPLETAAARALHWINLVSGEFFAANAGRFDRDGRADQVLLGNLRYLRDRLSAEGLIEDDICHDLLARVIFVQFLFHRKDSDGAAALNPGKLARLYDEGILAHKYTDLASVLNDYEDTYRLFDWLNVRFNGDLFPGKGGTVEARATGWAKERLLVKPHHLHLLANFIRGDLVLPSGQWVLWPQYAFDVIPLEFISSIYETFVIDRASRDAIFYTPPHLVDFILDRVLPWHGAQWDIRILDPACGSGIFLVKSFQRLVHRWRRAHPGQAIKAETLRRLLERNLFGVDKDPHAVRVACFSLYLAMCDEIEPRHYWTQVVFPPMRDQQLICADFFEEREGIKAIQNRESYDLIVGNAPWGDNLITLKAAKWATETNPNWTIANKDIGGLFLAKGVPLLRAHGYLAMIQSANSLLFNNSTTALRFRKEVFSRRRVTEIYNLSALRFKVFKRKSHTTKRSISPACVVIMRPGEPSLDDKILYVSPKTLKPLVDEFAIVVEPRDRRLLTVRDALSDRLIWTILMWGGARDRALVQRLAQYPTLGSFESANKVKSSRGVQFGDRQKRVVQFSRHRLFDASRFPADSLLSINADNLPKAGVIHIHFKDAIDAGAFALPQLIVKRSWRKSSSRFEARLVKSSDGEGVICNQSYLSAHGPKKILTAAYMALNSKISTYMLQLVSGRIAAYRPEALISEIRDLPIPKPGSVLVTGVNNFKDIDERVYDAFKLKDAERVLVEDMFNYVIPDFRADANEPGFQRTAHVSYGKSESVLTSYCQYFSRVLKAGFGGDRTIRSTIFRTDSTGPALPYRLVAFELGTGGGDEMRIETLGSRALLQQLEKLDHGPLMKRRGLYARGVARIYDGTSGTPTIFMLKPDMARHWTRSIALEDGDEVALDLFRWQQKSSLQASHH